MIPGITSSGSYPNPFVQKVKTGRPSETRADAVNKEEVQHQPELKAPEGDEQSLLREFTLFELAFREFDRMIPRLDLVNAAFE
jgi:hypothetical protein